MARFYFHFLEGTSLATDDEGIELPDLSAAVREAELAARELLAEAIKAKKARVPEAVVITDHSGERLHTIPLAAVLPEPLKR
jgi:hypothetical protein